MLVANDVLKRECCAYEVLHLLKKIYNVKKKRNINKIDNDDCCGDNNGESNRGDGIKCYYNDISVVSKAFLPHLFLTRMLVELNVM